MGLLKISLLDGDVAADPTAMEALRRDLDDQVGPADFGTSHAAGAKGLVITDVATIAVSVLSSQAVLALIAVLKSYLERDRSAVVVLGDRDGGSFRVEAKDARILATREFSAFIERARKS